MTLSKKRLLPAAFAIALLAAGCSANEQNEKKPHEQNTEPVKETSFEMEKAAAHQIDHIQGLGYPGNDTRLYIATNEGIKIFDNGEWLESTSQNHDYMGFQVVKDGFIASGHPEEKSDLKDPLGLVKSTDKGAELKKLAFYGENEFQFLSAGYGTKTVYLINQHENSELKPGVYVSENEGKSWDPVRLNGLESDTLGMIAAHPSNKDVMAMSTRSGIFLSKDMGENVERITDPVMATALAFSDNSLYYSSVENEKVLLKKADLETLDVSQIEFPYLNYDNPVTYISVDHQNDQTISFATYLKDIYQSTDGGKTWDRILKNGKIE